MNVGGDSCSTRNRKFDLRMLLNVQLEDMANVLYPYRYCSRKRVCCEVTA